MNPVEKRLEAPLAYQAKAVGSCLGGIHMKIVEPRIRVIVAQEVEHGGPFDDLNCLPKLQAVERWRTRGNIFNAELRQKPTVEFDNIAVGFFNRYRSDVTVIACEASREQTVLPAQGMSATAMRDQLSLMPGAGGDEGEIPPEAMMMRLVEAVRACRVLKAARRPYVEWSGIY